MNDSTFNKIDTKEQLIDSSNLSLREKEVLILILDGYENKTIAKKIFISTKTVEKHKENIKSKMGIESIRILYERF